MQELHRRVIGLCPTAHAVHQRATECGRAAAASNDCRSQDTHHSLGRGVAPAIQRGLGRRELARKDELGVGAHHRVLGERHRVGAVCPVHHGRRHHHHALRTDSITTLHEPLASFGNAEATTPKVIMVANSEIDHHRSHILRYRRRRVIVDDRNAPFGHALRDLAADSGRAATQQHSGGCGTTGRRLCTR